MIDQKQESINVRPITDEEKETILSRFVSIPREAAKLRPRFCVDGRTGKRFTSNGQELPNEPYLQNLGGDIGMVTYRWLLSGGQADFIETEEETFNDLGEAGYPVSGAHDGGHAHDEASDCGFADNNRRIIETLFNRTEEIWQLIEEAASGFPQVTLSKERFLAVVGQVRGANLDLLPSGKAMVDKAASMPQAAIQHLEADHKEIAAVVNLKPETTLNTDANQDNNQAFNLDLWFILEQAKALGLDQEEVMYLALGLYVATEMILVEAKRGIRLPILINI